jgi:hypothetical protein
MITEFRNLGKSIIRFRVRGENQMTDLENRIHKTMEKCNKKSCTKYIILIIYIGLVISYVETAF